MKHLNIETVGWYETLLNNRLLLKGITFAKMYDTFWQIQPDGCYWVDDDGFGMEDDEEIILYSFIDQNGQFMGPFQIYCVGDTEYLSREDS